MHISRLTFTSELEMEEMAVSVAEAHQNTSVMLTTVLLY
jgi:hypothetical protein